MNKSRRNFLKASAALAGGTVFAAEPSETCGIAIGTYGLQSKPLLDALKFIAATGYDAAEITVFKGMTGEPSKLNSDARAELRTVADDAGLRITALMGDLKPNGDDKKHLEVTEDLRRQIELAHDLKTAANDGKPPLIQTILAGKKWEDSRELFRDRLADWIQICADQKVKLAIKPHRGHAMSTPEHAAWLLKQLGSNDWLSMVYDFSHYAFRDGLTIENTIKNAAPITGYVAVKDTVMVDGKAKFALAGEGGNWDTAEIVGGLFKGGFRGDFCCEVSSQIWRGDPDYDAEAATKVCYENMVAAFEKAGVTRG